MYAQMLVGMVAFTGQWWLDARKPKLEEVAANLIDLAWNGLSQLDATMDREGSARALSAGAAPGASVTVPAPAGADGRPSAAQARNPPITSVARCRPRSSSAAAARLEVYPSTQKTMIRWS